MKFANWLPGDMPFRFFPGINNLADPAEVDFKLSGLSAMLQSFTRGGKKANCMYLFDLDEQADPVANPLLLLTFDKIDCQKMAKRPAHSNDILKINEGRKSRLLARAYRKTKVVAYCREHRLPVPGLRPIN